MQKDKHFKTSLNLHGCWCMSPTIIKFGSWGSFLGCAGCTIPTAKEDPPPPPPPPPPAAGQPTTKRKHQAAIEGGGLDGGGVV